MKTLELKNTITEMKNSLKYLESRFQMLEERIRKLEDKYKYSNLKNREKNEVLKMARDSDLWENTECINVCGMRVPKTKEVGA